MQLAINYSLQALELLNEGRIRFERFKCADWPDMIADARRHAPVYVHFPLEAGLKTQRNTMPLDDIAMMRDDTDTPFVNTHLIAFADDGQTDAEIEQAMLADVRRLVERFNPDRVMAENIPFYATGLRRPYARCCVDPALIRRVLDHTGCGLLLDISHARIAAKHLNIDAKTYIESLPVDRLRELHVTGVDVVDGRLLDHMPFSDEDWTWVEWAMSRIESGAWARPWCMAFEYGGIGKPFAWRSNKDVIEKQLPRLWELVHS